MFNSRSRSWFRKKHSKRRLPSSRSRRTSFRSNRRSIRKFLGKWGMSRNRISLNSSSNCLRNRLSINLVWNRSSAMSRKNYKLSWINRSGIRIRWGWSWRRRWKMWSLLRISWKKSRRSWRNRLECSIQIGRVIIGKANMNWSVFI